MTRQQLEHILRASSAITSCREILVLGSQAILGSYPDAPNSLLISIEADVSPLDAPDKADLIDACIGELSLFHETFGYYAHGIAPETAVLPKNWRERLVPIESSGTAGNLGWCLSPLDLAVSKLIAGRQKDMDYVRTLIVLQMVEKQSIMALGNELTDEQKALLYRRLTVCLSA